AATLFIIAALLPAPAAASAVEAPPAVAPATPTAWAARPARVVLIGDSVAASAAESMQAEAARRGIRLDVHARDGCGFTSGIPAGTNSAGCVANRAAFLGAAAREPADAVIVMSSWE